MVCGSFDANAVEVETDVLCCALAEAVNDSGLATHDVEREIQIHRLLHPDFVVQIGPVERCLHHQRSDKSQPRKNVSLRVLGVKKLSKTGAAKHH